MALIFEICRYILTMLFGIFVSAEFLNLSNNRKNSIILATFASIDLIAQGVLLYTNGLELITAIYPLVAHVPLLILFVLAFKKNLFPSILAITTAYLCCQIANWISVVVESMHTGLGMIEGMENIIYSITLVVTYILIKHFMVSSYCKVLAKQDKYLVSFSIVPVFYYIFDYISTVYTEMLYQGNVIAIEFTPFLLAVCYLVFCSVYFKQYEEKQEVENRNRLVEIKAQQSQKDIDTFKRNEKTISLLRHDMRHFLNSIYDYIDNQELDKAKEYIEEIVDSIDKTTRKRYCNNETINTIISFYDEVMGENNIEFKCDFRVSKEIDISDVDMTSILSNGLENAIREVRRLDEEKRVVELEIIEKSGKLLISLENTFKKKPIFVDGMPISSKAGHGYGTQSIQYTVEKLNGNCQFSVKEDRFILQIVL